MPLIYVQAYIRIKATEYVCILKIWVSPISSLSLRSKKSAFLFRQIFVFVAGWPDYVTWILSKSLPMRSPIGFRLKVTKIRVFSFCGQAIARKMHSKKEREKEYMLHCIFRESTVIVASRTRRSPESRGKVGARRKSLRLPAKNHPINEK